LTYQEKLLDPKWQKKRLEVFERDKWTCCICGQSHKTLNAHHIQYHPLSEGPWDYEIDSLITLCKECHSQEHISINSAKANLIIALTKAGYKTSYDFECLTDEIAGGKYVKKS